MRTIRTIAEMRAWLGNARAEGRTVGLVPTMGAFHAGHHSLMRAAREEQRRGRRLAVRQPRAVQRRRATSPPTRAPRRNDAAEAAELGVDVLFAPPASEIYPDGFATTVQRRRASPRSSRAPSAAPGHFAGVCTVVDKLLNIVAPDVAYFGQKDAQQVAVVKRMVRDLDMPVADRGPADRARAGRPRAVLAQRPALARRPRARARPLARACTPPRDAVAAGERDAERVRAAALAELGDVEPEYLAIVDPLTFAPLHHRRRPARSSRSPRRSAPSA